VIFNKLYMYVSYMH